MSIILKLEVFPMDVAQGFHVPCAVVRTKIFGVTLPVASEKTRTITVP